MVWFPWCWSHLAAEGSTTVPKVLLLRKVRYIQLHVPDGESALLIPDDIAATFTKHGRQTDSSALLLLSPPLQEPSVLLVCWIDP